MASFREIAASVDRLYPPYSLRSLARRFRYANVAVGDVQAGVISLRALSVRVNGLTSDRLELLHYNTFLLRAKIRAATILKELMLHPLQLSECGGMSAATIVLKILDRFTSNEVCDAIFPPIFSVCGLSVNLANDACKLAGAGIDLAIWLLGKIGGGVAAIMDLLGVSFDWVLDLLFDDIMITLKEKPEIPERAFEIGREVHSYGITSLVEVWEDESRGLIMQDKSYAGVLTGPPRPSSALKVLASGILVLSPEIPIEDGGTYVYWNDGVSRPTPGGCDFGALVDSDKWSGKGTQLTRVNLGCGSIDLYSTHLYSGGDMPDLTWLFRVAIPLGFALPTQPPTDEEIATIRLAQVKELLQFVGQTHNPENVAIIVGDFNISASSATYDNSIRSGLKNLMDDAGFDDWWNLEMFKEDDVEISGGLTNRHGDGDEPVYHTFDTNCKVYDRDVARPNTENVDDYYCDESQPADQGATGERIDYIFVERPRDQAFNLDVSRIRRRAFKRPGTHSQPEYFMSDHLGLEVTLFASNRA